MLWDPKLSFSDPIFRFRSGPASPASRFFLALKDTGGPEVLSAKNLVKWTARARRNQEIVDMRAQMQSIASLSRWSQDRFSFRGWHDRFFRERIASYLLRFHCHFTLASFCKQLFVWNVLEQRPALPFSVQRRIDRNRGEAITHKAAKRRRLELAVI